MIYADFSIKNSDFSIATLAIGRPNSGQDVGACARAEVVEDDRPPGFLNFGPEWWVLVMLDQLSSDLDTLKQEER